MPSDMVDQQEVDEVVAIGDTAVGSPTVMNDRKSSAASRHASVKHHEHEGQAEQAKNEEHAEQEEQRDIVDSSPTTTPEPVIIGIEEQQSPAQSDKLSQAPTLLTTKSNYTANTGGRARESYHASYRASIANLWRPPSTFLSSDDGSELSVANEESAASSSGDIPQIEVPDSGASSAPVTKPDEPRSFFDSDSESGGETIIRTASRASSVRGERPKLVQNHSSSKNPSRTRFYQSSHLALPSNPGPSQRKAEQLLGTKLKNLLDLTPAVEKGDQLASFRGGTAAVLSALTTNELAKASTTAIASATPTATRSFNSTLMIEVPDQTSKSEGLGTLPTPLGGFGSVRLSRADSNRFVISPLDALRSNPVSELETIGLHRAVSAPPAPYRRNRKVTIQPVDMEVIHTANGKKLFRDSIVTTPYPSGRKSLLGAGDHEKSPDATKDANPASLSTEKPSSQSPTTSQMSPPEILVLELAVANHPQLTKMITIPIHDRSTFDDKALFASLRHTYNHTLLGFARRYLSARALSNATFIFPTITTSFDTADFLNHFQNLQSGHKRKTWLQWLRKHQPRHASATSSPTTSNKPNPPYFSSKGAPRTAAFVDPRTPPPPPSGSNFSSPISPSGRQPPAIPKIIFDHTFAPLRIGVAISIVILLTILTTMLWVLFGVPGVSAAAKGTQEVAVNGAGGGGEVVLGDEVWKVSAQKRVLTGLVMGMMVFLMGAAGVGGWVGGSVGVL